MAVGSGGVLASLSGVVALAPPEKFSAAAGYLAPPAARYDAVARWSGGVASCGAVSICGGSGVHSGKWERRGIGRPSTAGTGTAPASALAAGAGAASTMSTTVGRFYSVYLE